MTQPPEETGGQPGGSPGGQDNGSPGRVPPPGSWHFPPPGAPQPHPPQDQPYAPPGYGAPPPHGPGQQYAPPGYSAPPPHEPGQQYAPPRQYGTPQDYGTPQQYGPPPPYAAPPPYGTSPYYGTPQYGMPYGPAYPAQATGFPAGPEPDLAEWWRRLLARLIDGVVLTALTLPIAIPLLTSSFRQFQQIANRYPDPNVPGAQAAISRADGKLFGMFLAYLAIVTVISFLYDAIQHGLWGQTLGKRALGTRVVSAYDRSKITGGMAAGRAAMYALLPLVPLAGSVYSLVDVLWLLGDRRRQCLHDKPAHTIVIKTGLQQQASRQQGGWQQGR
jgi:uncharacterized RDD family membrane protein YckC